MKLITTILTTLAFASLVSYGADEAKKDKPKVDPAEAFAKKDTNSDGKLSKEEFMAKQKDAAKAETTFAAKDKDKDGSLSKEEFMAQGKKKKKDA
jgi:Ca2+-binding EF-hand superfamily protein